jgi:hypothetical protein
VVFNLTLREGNPRPLRSLANLVANSLFLILLIEFELLMTQMSQSIYVLPFVGLLLLPPQNADDVQGHLDFENAFRTYYM